MNIAGDDILEEYIILGVKIKELTTRHEEIKRTLKNVGTYATDKHVCIVADSKRTQMASVAKCVEALGEVLLKRCDLIQICEITTVRVQRKS